MRGSMYSSSKPKRTAAIDVDGVLATLLAIIGVKQGDLLGPELFDFFIAAVMESWRAEHSYEHCTFRTRRDFQMAGRRPMATGDEFTVSDLEYADDTGMPFCSRADAEEQSRRPRCTSGVGACRFIPASSTRSCTRA